MKRLHVHVAVDDLAQSIRFYSTLFATEPTVVKDDYAKWMLEDPRVIQSSPPNDRSVQQGRTGPQSPMDIGYGALAFLLGNEVQG